MTEKKERKYAIIYQPRRQEIDNISGELGVDLEGDEDDIPIFYIRDLSESSFDLWMENNESKCLCFLVRSRGKELYNRFEDEAAYNYFFKCLDRSNGAGIDIDMNE